MEITKKTTKLKCVLKLNGDMTIYTAMENKSHLEPYFNLEKNITLNMSKVNEFDSSGFQLLLLLEHQTLRNDHTFNIEKCSPAVEEVLSLYNKKEWIG